MPIWTPDDGLVTCTSCGATFPPDSVPEEQLDRLVDRHFHRSFLHELGLLCRTKALFERQPDARRVVESIQRRSLDSLLFGGGDERDEERTAEDAMLSRWTEGDPELWEFLMSSAFDLEPRMAFVERSLAEIQHRAGGPPPACPRCAEVALEFVESIDD